MKTFEIDELKEFVSNKDLANLFHIHTDETLAIENNKVFNILRTLYLTDLNEIPISYFEYYVVRETDTWPGISFKLYRTVELWWMLMKLNNIKDPFIEPIVDSSIRYISKDELNNVLKTIKNS